jgi:1-acyl-sn-glycerol-3-phosphate acyltransferase
LPSPDTSGYASVDEGVELRHFSMNTGRGRWLDELVFTTLSVARWTACVLTSTPLLIAACMIAPVWRPGGAGLLRLWAGLQCRIFGVAVHAEHRNPSYASPPYVFTQLNQTSLIESIITPLAIPTVPYRTFANVEYLLLPLLGWAHWCMGAVLVVRQWPWHRRRALARAKRLLRRGSSFFISIEGRRSAAGLQEYRTGPIRLAAAARAPIVPFVLVGARERLPIGAWRVRPGVVRVVFLPEVSPPADDQEAVARTKVELRLMAERALDGTGSERVPRSPGAGTRRRRTYLHLDGPPRQAS